MDTSKWKIYKDPAAPDPLFSLVKGKEVKIDKNTSVLDDIIFTAAHYCNSEGNLSTVGEISLPDYKPWIVVHAKIEGLFTRWRFLYNPSSEEILVRSIEFLEWRKINCTHRIYKKLRNKLELVEPQIHKQTHPSLISTNLVNVQPMSAPIAPI